MCLKPVVNSRTIPLFVHEDGFLKCRLSCQSSRCSKVALAEMYGKKAGTLRQEQARLQHELQDVNGRIEKTRKEGETNVY